MAVAPGIIEALKRLNPSTPASASDYVGRDWPGMSRGWDLPDRLIALLAAGETVRAVMHGPIGAGKSSELDEWERQLSAYANVVRLQVPKISNSRTERETAPDVVLTACLESPSFDEERQHQVRRWIEENWSPEDSWDPIAELMANLAWPVPDLPTVVLFDGLDLLQDQGLVFGRGIDLASILNCSYVAIGSHPWFVFTSREERSHHIDHIWELPVFGVQDPRTIRNEAAIATMADGLARRLGEFSDVFVDPDAAFRNAAYYSGGIPRDAIRILRAAVLSASRLGRVNGHHLLQGLGEIRQDLAQSLSSSDLNALKEIAKTGNHEAQIALVAKNAILSYEENFHRYWLPHPLLRPLLDLPTELSR